MIKLNDTQYQCHHGTLDLCDDGWHLTSPFLFGYFLYERDELDVALADMQAGVIDDTVRTFVPVNPTP